MKLCDDHHTEICYIGYSCPLCDAQKLIDEWESEADSLKEEVKDLKAEIKEMTP